MKKGELQPT